MREDSLVSIIIPAYNSAAYIREAIGSARTQTYQNIEIIVVDDGSTDNLKKILTPYITKGLIRYFYEGNKGLAAARNFGMRNAKGNYIAFLDADDIFLSGKIETQVKYLETHPECDVSYCDIWHFYEDSGAQNVSLRYNYYSGDEVFPNLLKKNFINPLTVVMRSSLVGRFGFFNEQFRRSEDWEYWVRLSWRGARFCFLPEKLARYRIRRTSMSYDWRSEVERKRKELEIFRWLRSEMSPQELRRFHIRKVLLIHWLKLLYAQGGDKVKMLRAIHLWLQRKRLASA